MNKVIMMGRLTRDPEVRYSTGANSTAVGKFSIAVDRKFKREGQPEADFFNCTTFGKQAEFIEKYLRKGVKVVISGTLQNDNYTTKDGAKVYGVNILVDEIEFAESKANSDSTASSGKTQSANQSTPSEAGTGFMNIPNGLEEELPFT